MRSGLVDEKGKRGTYDCAHGHQKPLHSSPAFASRWSVLGKDSGDAVAEEVGQLPTRLEKGGSKRTPVPLQVRRGYRDRSSLSVEGKKSVKPDDRKERKGSHKLTHCRPPLLPLIQIPNRPRSNAQNRTRPDRLDDPRHNERRQRVRQRHPHATEYENWQGSEVDRSAAVETGVRSPKEGEDADGEDVNSDSNVQ